jgi:glycogen operon protein
MFNAYWDPLVFELPPMIPGHPPWRRWIDTYRSAPDDIHEPAFGPPVLDATYTVQPRSLVTLFAQGTGATSAGPSSPRRR